MSDRPAGVDQIRSTKSREFDRDRRRLDGTEEEVGNSDFGIPSGAGAYATAQSRDPSCRSKRFLCLGSLLRPYRSGLLRFKLILVRNPAAASSSNPQGNSPSP